MFDCLLPFRIRVTLFYKKSKAKTGNVIFPFLGPLEIVESMRFLTASFEAVQVVTFFPFREHLSFGIGFHIPGMVSSSDMFKLVHFCLYYGFHIPGMVSSSDKSKLAYFYV